MAEIPHIDDDYASGELIYYAHTLDSEFTELYLPPISDVHDGNPLHSRKHLRRTIAYIAAEPNRKTVLNGDMIEAITRGSVGDIFKQVGTPQDQADSLVEEFYPIKDDILGVTSGNHEDRIYREVGWDVARYIAQCLGVPYRSEGMLLKISFGDGNNYTKDKPYVFWLYMTHGYGGARTKPAKAVKVERTATWIDADCYIMSHDHVVNVAPDIYLKPDNRTRPEKDRRGNETGFTVGRVKASRKMLVKSNAYLKWGGYSEKGGFPPVDMTTPVIKFLTPKSPLWESLPDRPQQAVKVEV